MNNKICAICKGKKLTSIRYKNKWSELFNDKSILVCDSCGFGRIDPQIDSKSILDFYKDVYRSKNSPHYVDFSRHLPAPSFYRAKSISQLLLGLQYLEHKKKYNFLDVGAGLGKSFVTVKEIFNENVQIHAIEQDKGAKKYYQQHFKDVTISSNISEFNNIMDIVLMSHSLEHFDIDDMAELFKHIHNTMVKNAIMIIEVPHADFRDKEYEKHRPIDTPHLSFFSLDSLRKLAESTNFELCFIDTAGILIDDMHFQDTSTQKIIPLFRRALQVIGLHSLLARWKRNLFLKIREYFGRDDFYKNVSFQYNGNRAVIRCILRKNQNN